MRLNNWRTIGISVALLLPLLGVLMAYADNPQTGGQSRNVPVRPFDHGDEVDLGKFKYVEGKTVPETVGDRPLAKFELKDKIYHGVLLNTDTQAGFDKGYQHYIEVAGKKPSMIGCFHCRWNVGKEEAKDSLYQRLMVIDSVPNVLPFIKSYTGDWQPKGPFMKADDILAGKEDDYFIGLAEQSVKFGKPFLLSFDHEMNGDWFPYSELFKGQPTDWTAEKFVKVWRRIYTIFQDHKATNVAFAWCPSVNGRKIGKYDSVNSHKAYYPGDEYVDWVGGSYYNDVNPYFMDGIAAAYPNKPIIVAEWGTESQRGAWYQPQPYPGDAKWMELTFKIFLKRYPNIKAFTYFQWGKTVNIERIPEQIGIYREGIADPKFLSND